MLDVIWYKVSNQSADRFSVNSGEGLKTPYIRVGTGERCSILIKILTANISQFTTGKI
jgi:hypothetical protein